MSCVQNPISKYRPYVFISDSNETLLVEYRVKNLLQVPYTVPTSVATRTSILSALYGYRCNQSAIMPLGCCMGSVMKGLVQESFFVVDALSYLIYKILEKYAEIDWNLQFPMAAFRGFRGSNPPKINSFMLK